MPNTTEKNHDLLIRIGGLLLIGLVGVLVAACGLTMWFGYHRISAILFVITLTILALMKLIVVIMKR